MISNIVATVCARAGFPNEAVRTNHCLRATFVVNALRAGLSISAVMRRTGHKSEKGVAAYNRCVPPGQGRLGVLPLYPRPLAAA